ncbi:hypothetical protein IB642_05165 [Allofrancisella guangzhouensis]|uniref:Uncharacterized protein n=1 Tax=Allofrancisella guangzhouensis TaxID=594679 RepID=A0A0A8E457_9GAMM|nr:hypothetical protein [Allofrancisella guangzhouensis]AJC48788.1 hypothetical protein SD28_03640 [Allofrancisella guangzhouensis]MBK2028010.1 hypothetical protein [Allofrancisella guangzhouensis]MBK2044408.1 hypothetical protein [Allofrancisella guangzhouensis]MBK2045286.1 hypothetical protein [Allofrancisella guangzhouensis]
MEIQKIKNSINAGINNYLSRIYKNHKSRAIELKRFIENCNSYHEICLRIINEHSLFNLGYSLINVNLNTIFEHSIKNKNTNGAYYQTVIEPAFNTIFSINHNSLPLKHSSSNFGKMLIFRENSDFYDDLVPFLEQQKIHYKVLKEGNEWLRDTFFVGQEKIYIRTKQEINVKKQQNNLPCNVNSKKIYTQNQFRDLQDAYLITNKFLSMNRNFYDNHDFMAQHSNKRDLANLIKQDLKKDTIRPLEGGNLFEAINCEGVRYYFIGVNVLLNEIDFKNIKYGTMSDPSNLSNRDILSKCHVELERYKKIFKTDNVICLPQWAYHLDLQISYMGDSTFLIHSFNEVLNNIDEISSDINKKDQVAKFARDALQRELVIKYIDAILRSCGFKTIKYAGILHKTYQGVNENGEIVELNPKYALGQEAISTFINGIDLCTHSNKKFYLTIDSPCNNHKAYFTKLLKKQNIEVVYLKVNGKSAEDTVKHISYRGGALRCQTNFIPFDYLNQL